MTKITEGKAGISSDVRGMIMNAEMIVDETTENGKTGKELIISNSRPLPSQADCPDN